MTVSNPTFTGLNVNWRNNTNNVSDGIFKGLSGVTDAVSNVGSALGTYAKQKGVQDAWDKYNALQKSKNGNDADDALLKDIDAQEALARKAWEAQEDKRVEDIESSIGGAGHSSGNYGNPTVQPSNSREPQAVQEMEANEPGKVTSINVQRNPFDNTSFERSRAAIKEAMKNRGDTSNYDNDVMNIALEMKRWGDSTLYDKLIDDRSRADAKAIRDEQKAKQEADAAKAAQDADNAKQDELSSIDSALTSLENGKTAMSNDLFYDKSGALRERLAKLRRAGVDVSKQEARLDALEAQANTNTGIKNEDVIKTATTSLDGMTKSSQASEVLKSIDALKDIDPKMWQEMKAKLEAKTKTLKAQEQAGANAAQVAIDKKVGLRPDKGSTWYDTDGTVYEADGKHWKKVK